MGDRCDKNPDIVIKAESEKIFDLLGCDLFDPTQPCCLGSLHLWSPKPNDDNPGAEILWTVGELLQWRLHLDRPPEGHHPHHHLLQVPLPGDAGGVLEEHLQEGGGEEV